MNRLLKTVSTLGCLAVLLSTLHAQTIDYGIETVDRSITEPIDAGSLKQNIAQMWEYLDALVTTECQKATTFEQNSDEEQLANSIVCSEAGRFFQKAKDRTHERIDQEATPEDINNIVIEK